MRSTTGQINEFKKLNIIEKLIERYHEDKFFKEFNLYDESKKQFRRTREQPHISKETIQSQEENQTTQSYLKYEQKAVKQRFYEKAEEYKEDRNKLIVFLEDITASVVERPFLFSKELYLAPKKLTKQQETAINKTLNNQVHVKKYNDLKQNYYDFEKIHAMVQANDDETKKATIIVEGDIPAIDQMNDINKINEFEEVSKTFSYTFNMENVEIKLKNKNIYNIELRRDSILAGKGLNRIPVSFARDLGSIARKPPVDLSNLTSVELTLVPTQLRFCDLINIAAGRLIKDNIAFCVRNSAVTKQQLENQRKLLQRLQQKSKTTKDYDAAFGDQDIKNHGKQFNEDTESLMAEKQKERERMIKKDMIEMIETERLVSDVNELKRKIKTSTETSKAQKVEFQRKLQIILRKIVEDTDLPNPTELVLNFAFYSTKIEGFTRSGFDKKKLLWFYADCMKYFQLAQPDQNIKYLIDKSAKQKRITKTIIRENPKQLHTKDNKVYSVITKEHTSKKGTVPSKSPIKIRQFNEAASKQTQRKIQSNKN